MQHLRRSRIVKALTDAGLSDSFADAEARLDAVSTTVYLEKSQAESAAGQAAALTAVATAIKCFGRASLVGDCLDAEVLQPSPLGETIAASARNLGADVRLNAPDDVTHSIVIGERRNLGGWTIGCWWDRWLSGIRKNTDEIYGESTLPLAGVFSAALAVRQIFTSVRLANSVRVRDKSISLWSPWRDASDAGPGPKQFSLPNKVWFLGLGHLGQAYVWNLCFMPLGQSEPFAVLQDDQKIGEENFATSLLAVGGVLNRKKVRLARDWLEFCGWETSLIERRHRGDIAIHPDDPPYLLCGLDDLSPRLVMAEMGFDYMIDGGIGHGASDFETLQIRTIPKGAQANGYWDTTGTKTDFATKEQLAKNTAYKALSKTIGNCGTFMIAEASVAVPFVGAATGALAIAQLSRLASMEEAAALMQLEMRSPELMLEPAMTLGPKTNLGGVTLKLDSILRAA